MAKKSDPVDELADLKSIRATLFSHLDGVDPGSQTLGLGAISGQLVKVIARITELEGDSAEDLTIADQLAAARERKADGPVRPVRRGSKRPG